MTSKKSALVWVLGMTLSFAQAYAQITINNNNEDTVLNSEPIDVDGYVSEQGVSDSELEKIKAETRQAKTINQLNKAKSKELGTLTKETDKLTETTEQVIDAAIERNEAYKNYNKTKSENEKKLKCLLEENPGKDCEKWVKKKKVEPEVVDQVQTAQAAPVVVAAVPVVEEEKPLAPFEEVKLLPYVGATNFQGKAEKLETEFAGGVRLESNINDRFSMGVGFNYGQFSTDDFGNSYSNEFYYNDYRNNFGGQSRQIDYQAMGGDVYGKFFITRGARFRPYVGAGLGYQRMTLEYAENDNFSSFGQQFGNEEVTTGFMTMSLSAGTEFLFTRSIGLNIEFQYSRGFGGSSDNGVNPNNAPDQKRLQELSDEIIQANALSAFLGMLIIF